MWRRITKVLSNKTVMVRLAITLGLLLIFRIVSHIPIPLLDTSLIRNAIATSGSFLDILNNFSGQALAQSSILALGISPYITASIVVQLLQMVLPSLKELSEQGDSGKQKLNRITRYLAIALAFIQGLGLLLGLAYGTPGNILIPSIIEANALHFIYMALTITAGTAFSIYIGDLITKKGIGNGTSILIVAGIVTSFPVMITSLNQKYLGANLTGWNVVLYIFVLVLFLAILLGVVYLQIATRKVPIQYANRQGKSDSHIPIKLNSSGVIPVIFASTIMSIPLTFVGLSQSSGSNVSIWINQIFNNQLPIGFILYVILIVLFSFFYAFLTIDPNKMADNLQKSNAYIPSVKPGEDTKNFIARLLFKITVLGTVYLVVLAVLPIIISQIFGFTGSAITIGGTSLLIVVGVAVETTQQVETDAEKEEYQGIFKK